MDKSTKLYLWLHCVWLDWILFVIVTKEHLFMGPIKFIELSAHKSKTYQIFRKTKRHFCPLVSVMLQEQYWKLNSYLAICNLTIETEWKICENLYCSINLCFEIFSYFRERDRPGPLKCFSAPHHQRDSPLYKLLGAEEIGFLIGWFLLRLFDFSLVGNITVHGRILYQTKGWNSGLSLNYDLVLIILILN